MHLAGYADSVPDDESRESGPAPEAGGSQVLSALYDELRRIAARLMRRERGDHTLQPTALVHEAYLRLQAGDLSTYEGPGHLRAAAATVMRHVLVDHARQRRALKRGGQHLRITFDENGLAVGSEGLDLVDLHHALERLAAQDPRCAKVAELRLFTDAALPEIAETLEVSASTVQNEWRYAASWLRRALEAG
ncbi:MAG: ECF-type sigma factor [Myxococcota bacterium]